MVVILLLIIFVLSLQYVERLFHCYSTKRVPVLSTHKSKVDLYKHITTKSIPNLTNYENKNDFRNDNTTVEKQNEAEMYRNIGYIYHPGGKADEILNLYGRRKYKNMDNVWYYFAHQDITGSIRLPIMVDNVICQDSIGCGRLRDGDGVTIGGISDTYLFREVKWEWDN
jgi:hypothetical protein